MIKKLFKDLFGPSKNDQSGGLTRDQLKYLGPSAFQDSLGFSKSKETKLEQKTTHYNISLISPNHQELSKKIRTEGLFNYPFFLETDGGDAVAGILEINGIFDDSYLKAFFNQLLADLKHSTINTIKYSISNFINKVLGSISDSRLKIAINLTYIENKSGNCTSFLNSSPDGFSPISTFYLSQEYPYMFSLTSGAPIPPRLNHYGLLITSLVPNGYRPSAYQQNIVKNYGNDRFNSEGLNNPHVLGLRLESARREALHGANHLILNRDSIVVIQPKNG